MGNKINFLIGMLLLVFTYSILHMKVSRKAVILFASGVIAVFVLVSLLREGGSNSVFTGLRGKIEAYIVYNYKNLENLVRVQTLADWDIRQTSSPLSGIFSRVFMILSGSFEGVHPAEQAGAAPDFLVNPAYNLATFLAYPYQRYSYLGLTIVPLILGAISRYLYERLSVRPSLFILMVNVIMMCMLTFTFTAFEFTRPQFLFLLLLFLVVDHFVKRRSAGRTRPGDRIPNCVNNAISL